MSGVHPTWEKRANTVMPVLEAWNPKLEFTAKDARPKIGSPPPKPLSRGAKVILELLVRGRGVDGGWVDHDLLAEAARVRAVHSRIAEIRKHGYRIENNGRAGGRSRYRLVNE
jgi:hypothetical protein